MSNDVRVGEQVICKSFARNCEFADAQNAPVDLFGGAGDGVEPYLAEMATPITPEPLEQQATTPRWLAAINNVLDFIDRYSPYAPYAKALAEKRSRERGP